MTTNYIIYALGMRGKVIDKVFVPYREADGTLPIYSEALWAANGGRLIQKTENKILGIVEVSEAVRLIQSGGHRWRLKEYESGQANIFKPVHIVIREI